MEKGCVNQYLGEAGDQVDDGSGDGGGAARVPVVRLPVQLRASPRHRPLCCVHRDLCTGRHPLCLSAAAPPRRYLRAAVLLQGTGNVLPARDNVGMPTLLDLYSIDFIDINQSTL